LIQSMTGVTRGSKEATDLIKQINMLQQAFQGAGQITLGIANACFGVDIAKAQERMQKDAATSAYDASAESFFGSASKKIADSMQEDSESAANVSAMFTSVYKTASQMINQIGIMS